jgi:hypothetical protein
VVNTVIAWLYIQQYIIIHGIVQLKYDRDRQTSSVIHSGIGKQLIEAVNWPGWEASDLRSTTSGAHAPRSGSGKECRQCQSTLAMDQLALAIRHPYFQVRNLPTAIASQQVQLIDGRCGIRARGGMSRLTRGTPPHTSPNTLKSLAEVAAGIFAEVAGVGFGNQAGPRG